ncbi:MAG: protease modulator HflC [Pseudomonadota bacterium]
MSGARSGYLILAAIAGFILVSSVFIVDQRELAIKLRLGEVVQSAYEPGLQWKAPVIDTVVKFPRRILTISDRPERVFTAENEALQVDFFVKYRIVDPVRFYTSTGGVVQVGNDRLGEIIKNAIVTEFGKRTVVEAISVGRQELMQDMLSTAAPTAADLGAELIDFRVKQVEFMDDVRESVYRQMESERKRIAFERRAEGDAEAERIRAEADKQGTIIRAEANKNAQIVRGEGDARSAEIYASAYTRDPEFYAFYRSINAYRNSVGGSGDILVLDPNNEFFQYLNQSRGDSN